MDEALRRRAFRAVQVVTPGGARLEAGRAALYVLERTGGGRLARGLSRRPFIWGVEAAYRAIARSRRALERVLARDPGLCRAEDAAEARR